MNELWQSRLEKLEKACNYVFADKELLKEAFTHSSYANEQRNGMPSYERLEFLGDAVLELITAEFLYEQLRDRPEGQLTKIRASLVCERTLSRFARQLKLGELVVLGKGEAQGGGAKRDSILADVFEALLAALYVEGGYAVARGFVLPFLEASLPAACAGKLFSDYKTELQELVQSSGRDEIFYRVVEERGPQHDCVFTVQVFLNSNLLGQGEGRSKKLAEQAAARQALCLMGVESENEGH